MNEYRSSILSRMFIVLGLMFLIPFALAVQLIRINYVDGDGLRELWSRQAIDEIPIPAQRGNIYDVNGTLLATNIVDYQLALDPKVEGITREHIVLLVDSLSKITNRPTSYYLNKIDRAPSRSRYIVLARNLNAIQKDRIQMLGIRGVILEESFRRNYTFGSLAAHSLGFVNHNMEGRTGIEAFYNEQLKGQDGIRQVRKDPFGNVFQYVGAPKKQPIDGYSLYTTIDAYIQAILEDELKAGVEKYQANYGTGIIMDPRTGAIKALANYPTYDPNFPGASETENRRNFAISDMIEPGSTFKLVTAVSAVEQGKVNFEEIFHTPKDGKIEIHGLILRDHEPLGDLDFAGVIRKSSNVATAEIAMRLNKNKFYQYARNMGFGTPTYVDIAGEESGRMAKPYDWSLVTLPWMSHGYEVLATPIQIVQAYSAFANNGIMMRPYIVERIEDADGNIVKLHEPEEIRRIAKEKTLEKLYPIFESVVSDSGTGQYAQVEGLRIAGKTGTAKKVVDGRYSNKYRGSFVGFFPVGDPKYVCLIMLDEPKPVGYGGLTAGPIFQQVAKRIAGLDENLYTQITDRKKTEPTFSVMPGVVGLEMHQAKTILADMNLEAHFKGKSGYVADQIPLPGDTLSPRDKIILSLSETNVQTDSASLTKGLATIPDVRGMNMRNATGIITSLNLDVERIGSGTVFAQFPKPGAAMRPGGTVTIRGRARSLETLTKAPVNQTP